jgi:hypothetical protein
MMSSLFWRAQSPQALMADDPGAVGGERHWPRMTIVSRCGSLIVNALFEA